MEKDKHISTQYKRQVKFLLKKKKRKKEKVNENEAASFVEEVI